MPLFNISEAIPDQFIQLLDSKSANASGGIASFQSWSNRDINTISNDDTNSVILSANTFVLPAGSYIVDAASNFYIVNAVKMRLKNLTDGNILLSGITAYFNKNSTAYGNAGITGKFVIGENKSLALEYYVDSPTSSVYNLGAPVGDGSAEIYTSIDLRKVG
ncbi:hypothetical protein A6769_21965 [Nostoc punctiforme NIES-2108]|uniref:Uncharacterized protein n=1 Tax=Nostoc punctiforme NIES-2108 TaxID=1356359 RepID=A0A367RDI2_NOSPU|nr:hypothetical protein A6769_21965 [Nostoc punctiforme NIES-2108]